MKKTRAVTLSLLFGIVLLVLSIAPLLPLMQGKEQDKQHVSAGSLLDPGGIEGRFGYIKPDGDGTCKLSSVEPQYFRLQSRFLNSSGINMQTARPVFSSKDMNDIRLGIAKKYDEYAEVDNAGFVMLDDNDSGYNNVVVLEFEDLSSIRSFSAKYNNDSRSINQYSAASLSGLPITAPSYNWTQDSAKSLFQIRCVFDQEGYYEFQLEVSVQGVSGRQWVKMDFGFYIARASKYVGSTIMPMFDPANTAIKNHPVGSNNFFYNFQGAFPEIQYFNRRYAVGVTATDHNMALEVMQKDETVPSNPIYKFNQLGKYEITAEMFFPIDEYISGREAIRIPNYSAYVYSLDIFGLQGQYMSFADDDSRVRIPKWFAKPSDSLDCDITTGVIAGGSSFADINGMGDKSVLANNAIQTLVNTKLGGVTPVSTNSPPVSLRYNVSHAYADSGRTQPLTRVAYRKNSLDSWNFGTPYGNNLFNQYVVGKPFEQAGDYAVIVYYEYSPPNTAGNVYTPLIYHQIFYFRINNFAADVLLRVGGSSYSFDKLMERVIQSTDVITVDYDGTVGPFDVEPRLELSFVSFTGAIPPEPVDPVKGQRPDWFGDDGIYTFRVYYGGNQNKNHMPHMAFTVIVDNSEIPAGNFECFQGSDKNNTGVPIYKSDTIQNPVRADYISLFGAGDVTLQWGRKVSGVDMVSAEVEFYEFKVLSGFSHSVNSWDGTIFKSQFKVDPAVSWSPRIIMTDGGYRLSDKLSASGVYIIKIRDAAGNTTTYTIIIDATTAAFAQNPPINPAEANIQNGPTKVGVGTAKLITDNSGAPATFNHLKSLFIGNSPSGSGLVSKQGIPLYDNVNGGIAIPTALLEKSEGGSAYTKVYERTNPSYQTQYTEVDSQNSMAVVYLFRLTDLTGNVAAHYVEVNPDMTKGIVLEDNIPTIYDFGIKPTAMLVSDGMIASRDYVTFSFEQSSGKWHVDEVRVVFYPFDFSLNSDGTPKSAKYPFSVNPEPTEVYDVSGLPDGRHGIDINRNPKTRQGLYVIARICNSPLLLASEKIYHYRFIVDNNPVISAVNHITGIRIQFGNTSSSPTAIHSNFHKPNTRMDLDKDPVLRANSAAYIFLPNQSGKYGTSDTFSIWNLNSDLSSGSISFPFKGLRLASSVEWRAPNLDYFVPYSSSSSLEDSGMYRVAFTDGSGGRSWILGADAPESHDGNRSEVLIELNRQGPTGSFAMNGKRLSPSSYNTDGNRYSTRFETTDRLTFTYVKRDTSNFLLEVNSCDVSVSSDGASWDGFGYTPLEYTVGSTTYVEVPLSLAASNIGDGSTFRVRLRNTGNQQRDLFLTLDKTPPAHNLTNIIDRDQWYKDNKPSISSTKYAYRLDKGYVFQKAFDNPPNIYTFDTYRISYFEVDSRLANISSEQFLDYNDARGEFSKIVRLKDDENRFFRIVERDEAGNSTEYFVQLRGDKYIDYLEASGIIDYSTDRPGRQITGNLISEPKNSEYDPVRGYEITVGNVRTFFAGNLFFDLSVQGTNLSIKRFGLDRMDINGVPGVFGSATPENFAAAVQHMINTGQGSDLTGGSIRFRLDNRFKDYSWDLRQYTRKTEMFEIKVDTETASSISFKVDDSKFPTGLVGSDYFFLDVYELGSTNVRINTVNLRRSISVSNKRNEYRILAYDEFGRVARFAHNGLYGDLIDFRFSESMSEKIGGDLYVGSGVEFVYSTNAYINVEISREGVVVFRDGQILKEEFQNIFLDWETVNDLKVILLPEEMESVEWKISAKRRGTDVPYEKKFFLYGELPVLQFTNQSGDSKVSNGETVSGIVTVSFSMEGLKFPSSVEFWRTYYDEDGNKHVDWTVINAYLTSYPLRYEGAYEFIVTNALGFKSSPIKIFISDVSNKYYSVFFDVGAEAKKLEASPVPYHYSSKGTYIPNFVVTNFANVTVTPTFSSSWDVFQDVIDAGNIVYRLQSKTTKEEIFFAVTLVSSTLFNTVSGTAPLEFASSDSMAFRPDAGNSGFQVYYQLLYQPNLTITVTAGIDNKGWIGNQANVLRVEYRRDGKLAGSLRGSIDSAGDYVLDPLVISARDYGIYTFYVTDLAGNIRLFDGKDHFTLVNLARAPIHIAEGNAESAPIADGMVYNDTVYLTVRDLSAFYAEAYLSSMEVYLDNVRQDSLSYSADGKTSAKSMFSFSGDAHYRIECEYALNDFGTKIPCEFNFIVVSSTSALQSFSFVAPVNTEITSIRLYNTEIRRRFTDVYLRQVTLNSATGNGRYVVTLTMQADNIYQEKRTKQFVVEISAMLQAEVRASVDYGTSTTDAVTLSVNSQALFNAYENCRVLILRDGKVVDSGNKTIGFAGASASADNLIPSTEDWQLRVTAAGQYRVCVASVDAFVGANGAIRGAVYYSNEFEIKQAPNPLGTIIIIALIGVLIGAVILFIRLRTGMRVK